MASKKHGPIPGTPNARRSGEVVKGKYGTEYYSRLGKKGGIVTSEGHGSDHYSRIGAMGNKAGKQRPHVP